MTFQFHLNNTLIAHSEAEALFEACVSDKKPFTIDLENIIKIEKIDSKKLFELSVEKKSSELATLAWKLSLSSPVRTKKVKTVITPQKTKKEKSVRTLSRTASLDDLIGELNSRNSYWAVGAALILHQCNNEQWTTMKDVANNYVNKIWKTTDLSEKSVLFRGFVEQGEMLVPLEMKGGLQRRDTFHVCPLYIGMREGLGWCRRNNLIEQKSAISFGTTQGTRAQNVEQMQRVYYKIRATKRGLDMASMWADIDSYVFNFFNSRMA
jgi:hypothetical protein